MADPVEIAEKLSDAQRNMLIEAAPIWPRESTLFLAPQRGLDHGRELDFLELGLVQRTMRGFQITPLGYAVRHYLKDQQQ